MPEASLCPAHYRSDEGVGKAIAVAQASGAWNGSYMVPVQDNPDLTCVICGMSTSKVAVVEREEQR